MPRSPKPRIWDGRAVRFAQRGLDSILDNKPYRAELTEDAARKAALALSQLRQFLRQHNTDLEPEMEELLNSLNYVLVGDPNSVAQHQRMEAGKGMTPDGGHKLPATDLDDLPKPFCGNE